MNLKRTNSWPCGRASRSVLESQLLSRIKSILTATYGRQLVQTYLFGSRARRQAHKQSDYDVLAVLKAIPDRRLVRQAAKVIAEQIYKETTVAVDLNFVLAEDLHENTVFTKRIIKDRIPF